MNGESIMPSAFRLSAMVLTVSPGLTVKATVPEPLVGVPLPVVVVFEPLPKSNLISAFRKMNVPTMITATIMANEIRALNMFPTKVTLLVSLS
jgi:hypothetical protein